MGRAVSAMMRSNGSKQYSPGPQIEIRNCDIVSSQRNLKRQNDFGEFDPLDTQWRLRAVWRGSTVHACRFPQMTLSVGNSAGLDGTHHIRLFYREWELFSSLSSQNRRFNTNAVNEIPSSPKRKCSHFAPALIIIEWRSSTLKLVCQVYWRQIQSSYSSGNISNNYRKDDIFL